MAWTIKGEAGKAMDATLRSPETLRMSSGVLEFQSLAADTFKWTAITDNATGAGPIIPEVGQKVSLYKDGVRKFYGWAMRPKLSGNAVQVEVQGPWWWMEKIYLTSTQTDASGGTADRVQYVFDPVDKDLRTMILALLDRGITNGVPMLRGTGTQIAAMYPFTRITLSNMTIAAALVKLLARVPDAVAWFDYSTDGENPKLKIARRNGADAATDLAFLVGTDAVTGVDLSPRLDLEIKQVRLDYMDRHPVTTKPRFQKQDSSGSLVTGKLQILSISGPEIVNFLPLDSFDQAAIQTVADLYDTATARTRDTTLAALVKQYGYVPGSPGSFIRTYSGSTGIGLETGLASNYVSANTYSFPSLSVQRDNGQYLTAAELAGKYLVISEGLPDWAINQYGGVKVTIAGTWTALESSPWSQAFEALRSGALGSGGGTFFSITGPYYSWTARLFSYQAVLVNTLFKTRTTIYKAADYTFINPPAGMASGLRIAQDWVPWQGKFTVAADDVSASNQLGRTINLTGGPTACATMRALLKSQSYDLLAKTVTYQLGAPARIDFATAVGRVPTSPQDVIVKL